MLCKRVMMMALALCLTGPVRGQAEIEALVFDQWSQSGSGRLAALQLGYTVSQVQGEGFFIDYLGKQSWDLVIMELPHDDLTRKETVVQLLEDHVAGGGRLLVNFNNLDEWPRLQKLLGVEEAIDRSFPENVLPLSPRHASFAGFGLGANGNAWKDSGDNLSPMSDAVIVGEFSNGEGAIIVANETKTIVNGFDWDSYGAPVSFVRFQIQYIMACRADFDQSTGSEILDIFDFLAFQDTFINQRPNANLVYDKAFDIFDFLAFQDAFVNGCD